MYWPEVYGLTGKINYVENALWPQVKRTLPSYAGRIRESSLPTTTQQGTKLTLSLLPTTSSPKPSETVTKHQLVIIILDLQGCVGWRALWGSSHSKTPLKTGPTSTRSLSLPRENLCTAGAQAGSISNISVLLWLAPYHLLLLGKSASLYGKAPDLAIAFSKHVAWIRRLLHPPSALCSSTCVCFILCPYITVIGMQTERDPIFILPSYPSS